MLKFCTVQYAVRREQCGGCSRNLRGQHCGPLEGQRVRASVGREIIHECTGMSSIVFDVAALHEDRKAKDVVTGRDVCRC